VVWKRKSGERCDAAERAVDGVAGRACVRPLHSSLTGSSSWTKRAASPSSSRGRRAVRQGVVERSALPASAPAIGQARRESPLSAQAWDVGESMPEAVSWGPAWGGGRRNWAAGGMAVIVGRGACFLPGNPRPAGTEL